MSGIWFQIIQQRRTYLGDIMVQVRPCEDNLKLSDGHMGMYYTTLSLPLYGYVWNFLLKNKFKGACARCVVPFPSYWLEIEMTGVTLESTCGGWQSHPTRLGPWLTSWSRAYPPALETYWKRNWFLAHLSHCIVGSLCYSYRVLYITQLPIYLHSVSKVSFTLTESRVSPAFPIPLLFSGSLIGWQSVRTQSTFIMVTVFVPLEIRQNHKPHKHLDCTKTNLNCSQSNSLSKPLQKCHFWVWKSTI